ncbi:carotenoid oxygenase family protein [Candidatus Cyanaurora vandensis]|uniref:carotenoid oxygenase family protein n=1 Tax=Candidatus Cyanaurora vandensis TaxID=2714958 RepID=UPI00257AA489|nr:carotenoid oxygenase family protein [Candidatus Cyanaurora vandensis]
MHHQTRHAWARGYDTLREEHNYWIEDVTGTVPPQLAGTLWRNGPGQLELGGVDYKHPFDGDGMVCALTFQKGRVHFRNCYVQTAGYVQEQKAGRILYKNVFGTLKPGGPLANLFDFANKNVANTGVIYYAEKLWALWEAASPHRLDPHTLTTVGLDPLHRGLPFSAHPRLDPVTGHLWNFGVEVGLQTKLHLFEIDPTGRTVTHRTETLDKLAFIHDFVMTPRYAIFFQNPMALDVWPFVFGMKGAAECLHFAKGEPTRVLVLPKDGRPMFALETDPFFIFHHVNAYEDGELIQVDSVRYEEYLKAQEDRDFRETDFNQVPGGRVWRTTLDLARKQVHTKSFSDRIGEFPSVHPQQVGHHHRYCYLGTTDELGVNGPLQAISRLDLDQGGEERFSFAPGGFVGEPIFIPSAEIGTAAGWVVSLVYQASSHRTEVAIFDAERISQGPIATLKLPHHIPYGLHGSWSPGFFSKV